MAEDLRKAVITFPRPVVIGAIEVTSVTMREPTVADELLAAATSKSKSQGENEARLVAILCDLHADGVLSMRSAPYRLLQGKLMDFLSSPWSGFDAPSSSSPASADGQSPKSAE